MWKISDLGDYNRSYTSVSLKQKYWCFYSTSERQCDINNANCWELVEEERERRWGKERGREKRVKMWKITT